MAKSGFAKDMLRSFIERIERLEEERAVEEWLALDNAFATDDVARAFELDLREGEASADWPKWLALFDLGLRVASIVREPAFTVDPKKAARDAELGRPTMHLAQQWRHPLPASKFFAAEKGVRALMLPVMADSGKVALPLSLSQMGEDTFCEHIADLVAIPLDGGRPLSLTGFTACVGAFEPDAAGRMTFYGGGKTWLDAHLADIAERCADMPGDIDERLMGAPFGILMVEPRAFEWRVSRFDCALPYRTTEIACPDSRTLAQWIAAELRKKEKPRAVPTVRGPAARSSEAVAHAQAAKQERAAA
jgi:hypothetical protein